MNLPFGLCIFLFLDSSLLLFDDSFFPLSLLFLPSFSFILNEMTLSSLLWLLLLFSLLFLLSPLLFDTSDLDSYLLFSLEKLLFYPSSSSEPGPPSLYSPFLLPFSSSFFLPSSFPFTLMLSSSLPIFLFSLMSLSISPSRFFFFWLFLSCSFYMSLEVFSILLPPFSPLSLGISSLSLWFFFLPLSLSSSPSSFSFGLGFDFLHRSL